MGRSRGIWSVGTGVRFGALIAIFGVAFVGPTQAAPAADCGSVLMGCYDEFQCTFAHGMPCDTGECLGTFTCISDVPVCGEELSRGICWVEIET